MVHFEVPEHGNRRTDEQGTAERRSARTVRQNSRFKRRAAEDAEARKGCFWIFLFLFCLGFRFEESRWKRRWKKEGDFFILKNLLTAL